MAKIIERELARVWDTATGPARYEEDSRIQSRTLGAVYLTALAANELGRPKRIKVTIEALEG